MADFPTLSIGPNVEDFEQEVAVDPTIRSEFENGYQLSRNRFTTVPKKYKLIFEYLTAADKSALDTFVESTVGYGGASFDWENTVAGSTIAVRFLKPIKWSLNPLDSRVPAIRWKAEIELIEHNPSS